MNDRLNIKNTYLVLLLIGLLLAPSVAGRWSSPVDVYFGAGYSWPRDPAALTHNYGGSYNLMLGLGARTFPFMEIIGKYEYHRLLPNNKPYQTEGTLSAKMLGVDGKATLKLPQSPLEPYLLLGAGMCWLRQTAWVEETGPVFQAQANPYFDIGAGAHLKLGGQVGIFGQARIVHLNMSRQNSPTADYLHFWTITAGLKFTEDL